MKALTKCKDGGAKSTVDAYFMFEIKKMFSIAVLKFNEGSRENYHSHAFHAITWFVCGDLTEEDKDGTTYKYRRSVVPKLTTRNKFHKVHASKTSWCITIRGPWASTWSEFNRRTGEYTQLSSGRKIIKRYT